MYNVYLVSSEINNKKLYKIGYTKREISQRIKELQTGNASDFEIVDFFRSKWGTKIESLLHSKFRQCQVNREWFDLDDEDVSNFKQTCIKLHENFEMLEKYNTYVIDKGGLSKIK